MVTLTSLLILVVVEVSVSIEERMMLPTGAVVTSLLLVVILGKSTSDKYTELMILGTNSSLVSLLVFPLSPADDIASATLWSSKKSLAIWREAVGVVSAIIKLMSSLSRERSFGFSEVNLFPRRTVKNCPSNSSLLGMSMTATAKD